MNLRRHPKEPQPVGNLEALEGYLNQVNGVWAQGFYSEAPVEAAVHAKDNLATSIGSVGVRGMFMKNPPEARIEDAQVLFMPSDTTRAAEEGGVPSPVLIADRGELVVDPSQLAVLSRSPVLSGDKI